MKPWKVGDTVQIERDTYTATYKVTEMQDGRATIEHESGQLKSYARQSFFEKEGFKKV
ncbi:MAG TPA: hypothetical protein V6D25_02750 [Leptolyngbyaceae cyanobacterium]